MAERIVKLVENALGASEVRVQPAFQALWGGQGQLFRIDTDVPEHKRVIAKYIAPTADAEHPRGWNTGQSFARKAQSYKVECHWYRHYAERCHSRCKVPALLALEQDENISILLLEDLSCSWPVLSPTLTVSQVSLCLAWLAEFHALFLLESGDGLWEQGCYWHLGTRGEEWQAMPESPVKHAAGWLDDRLRQCRFQTLVHGDAKLANFCFSEALDDVAAVDFQYVGRGCGMRDVVYLLGSCLSGSQCEQYESVLLDTYFASLSAAIARRVASSGCSGSAGLAEFNSDARRLMADVETEWRSLYAIAWADFHRFLLGWMPGHAKINRYSESLVERALAHWSDGTASTR